MASGDSLIGWPAHGYCSPDWLYVAFTSGGTSAAPAKGDTIWGDTSNANAVLEVIVITSGTFAGGDAAGWMFLSNWNGTAWTSGENWTPNTTVAGNRGTFTLVPVSCFATPALLRSDTPCLDFDSGTNECVLFVGVMPSHYGGGGLTITAGVTSTTSTGDMSWGAAFKSITDDVDNLANVGTDPSGLKTFAEPNYNTAVDAPSAAGEVKYFTLTFTAGAEIDSVAAGEYFQLLLFRDARDGGNDDMNADARVVFLGISET
jgi:hypothetical protein